MSTVFTDEHGLPSSPEEHQAVLKPWKPCENDVGCNQNRAGVRRVAQVAQLSKGNAQANAANSTDLTWSRLVRDQEVGGSNPLAPTNS